MENEIAMITGAYLATRLGILAVIGYVVYRVVRGSASARPVSQSSFAMERLQSTQNKD